MMIDEVEIGTAKGSISGFPLYLAEVKSNKVESIVTTKDV